MNDIKKLAKQYAITNRITGEKVPIEEYLIKMRIGELYGEIEILLEELKVMRGKNNE